METLNYYLTLLGELAVAYLPRIILAIITLLVGMWLIKKLVKLLERVMFQRSLDESLRKFLRAIVAVTLQIMLFIAVAGMIGIETTSFIAIFAAAGLAIGLALQGGLANFAGSVLILIFKPYKVGDFIQAQGESGIVDEISIFNTLITTLDNKRVILPNGAVSNGNITNFSAKPIRRIDLVMGIGYDDDIRSAKETLMKILNEDPRILEDPVPVVNVGELGDSSVNLNVRPWVKTDDYWAVYHDVIENAKYALDEKGISIPYPQRDVHVYQTDQR